MQKIYRTPTPSAQAALRGLLVALIAASVVVALVASSRSAAAHPHGICHRHGTAPAHCHR